MFRTGEILAGGDEAIGERSKHGGAGGGENKTWVLEVNVLGWGFKCLGGRDM